VVCQSDNDLNAVVGPTECAKLIAPDQLQLSCSVTYSGNFAPRMEWRKMEWRKVGSELQSNETKCGVRGNRVMCNATMEANLNINGSVYICHIITAEQYNCSLKVIKTIYTFSDNSVTHVTSPDEVFCSANTSKDLSCVYKWYKDYKTEHIKLGQTLTPINPGTYRCQAECKIRNETCAFTAMVINAPASVLNNKLLWLLVPPFILLGVIVVICFLQKRGKPQLINVSPPSPLQGHPPGTPAEDIRLGLLSREYENSKTVLPCFTKLLFKD